MKRTQKLYEAIAVTGNSYRLLSETVPSLKIGTDLADKYAIEYSIALQRVKELHDKLWLVLEQEKQRSNK